MLKSEEILEKFKKSLTAATRSISQCNLVEINFTKENSSINGNLINLPEPNIESLKHLRSRIQFHPDYFLTSLRVTKCCKSTANMMVHVAAHVRTTESQPSRTRN